MTQSLSKAAFLVFATLAPPVFADESDSIPPPAATETQPPAPTASVAPVSRIAVRDFTADGISKRVARVVGESVATEIRKLRRVAVVSMAEIRAILEQEAEKQRMGCSDESCLSELAGMLGVDTLVVGQLSKVSKVHMFTLRRIDQRQGVVIAAVDMRLKAGDGEEFLAAVGPAVEKLFEGQELREGAKRGVAREVAALLNPPPLPRWSMLIPAALTGTALAVGLGLGAVAGLAMADYQWDAWRGKREVIDGRTLVNKGRASVGFAVGANVMFAAAFASLLACGVVAFFVDWYGYRDVAGLS